jgi:DNA invertase Pin-like site-specific DNA recombinase
MHRGRPRDQLGTALNYLRDGDTLVVTKLDRLPARCRTC